jgi:phosphoribosylaminoimidazole-succinocarboxamide synthase
MGAEDWEAASAKALELFAFGQAESSKRGLILVDTKYEFGKDAKGNLTLVRAVEIRFALSSIQPVLSAS